MRPFLRRLGGVVHAYAGVIGSRSYFPLWLGQLVSNFADTLHYIALVILVFRLTGRGLPVAGLVAAEVVPLLALGPVAGVVIDWFSRKAVLIAADLSRAVLALSLVWPHGVWHACGVAAWLEYRNLRYYPSNLALAGVQELTAAGVWYFTARFLDAGASASVAQYGGNYLAYVVVGVLLNQICLAALNGPFTTISEAFWDKRLETYRLSIHGIRANLLGRLGWAVGFSVVLQGAALVVLLLAGGLGLHAGVNLPLVIFARLLLVAANAGLGVAGASLFFLLEVKSGQDPITWAYRYLVMLVSGLYVPLAILPGWLRAVGAVLPRTYGLAAARAGLDWRGRRPRRGKSGGLARHVGVRVRGRLQDAQLGAAPGGAARRHRRRGVGVCRVGACA